MVYLLGISLLLLLYFCDCQRFQNGLIEENKVWANNSGPALFKWRYTPQTNDEPGVGIRCFFKHNDDPINVIRRIDTNKPVVQNNEIQSFSLNGKVQPYMDSKDPTIFGFTIDRVSISDPKEYQCVASFESLNGKDADFSRTLSLQIADPPDVKQCLNDIKPAKYESILTVKCYAPGNPDPTVTCQLWDENDVLLRSLDRGPENYTSVVRVDKTLLKLRKIVCFITAEKTGSYNKTTEENQVLILRPPFPPKNFTQIFPEGALATSVYLQWREIPVAEQGGGFQHYGITFWSKEQPRNINKTDRSIGKPTANKDGIISYEIEGLQTGQEYQVDVYGVNQYSTDAINEEYYVSRITAIPQLPPTPAASTSNKNTGAIIGGVIGGVVFIIIVSILVVYCTRRDDKQKHFPTSYVDDVVDYPPAQGGHQLYSTVEKKRLPSHDDDSTSGYPDIISTTQNGDYGNQMRSKSSSSFEPSSKVYL